MGEVDPLELALKRERVKKFPPEKHGAALSDNPQTEVWGLQSDLAEALIKRAEEEGKDPGELLKIAIRQRFRLPDIAGEAPIHFDMEGPYLRVVLDRDDDLTEIIRAVAQEQGNTTHLAVLEECIKNYLFPPTPIDEPA